MTYLHSAETKAARTLHEAPSCSWQTPGGDIDETGEKLTLEYSVAVTTQKHIHELSQCKLQQNSTASTKQ